MTQLYKCPDCDGQVTSEKEMVADYASDGDGGEIWSNWICPHCGAWHTLKCWIKVDKEKDDGSDI